MKGKFAAALRPLALIAFLVCLGWIPAAAMSGCSLLADDSGPSVAAPRVSSIKFEKAAVTVDSSVGEYIKYHVEPAAIQSSVTMAWDYDKDVISIDPDRYGVIVNGKKLGATYLRASADGVSATVLINVAGNPDVFEGEPYIYSDFQVVELTPGSSTTVTASLYGGSSADYEDMTWSIKDPTVADINWARGSCVVQAKRVGATQVTVHHPKSAYDYTMVVFVYTDAMTAPYITTGQNIVVINKTSETQKTLNFAVRNPIREDYAREFTYEAAALHAGESPCFEVSGNGDTALVTPKGDGLSKLIVRNAECEFELEVLVKVVSIVQNVYITTSESTVIVTGSDDRHNVFAQLNGMENYDPEEFVWKIYNKDDTANEITSSDCMEWNAVGNQLSIQGKKNGAFRAKVSHPCAEMSRSFLIILREQAGSAIDASMYITTESNYVQTQVGASDTTVRVSVVGGVPGDETNLTWTVDDPGHLTEFSTPTGTLVSKSMASGTFAYGTLIVHPTKAGTATVTVTHPKVLYPLDIKVRVYSEYALLEEPLVIKIKDGAPALLKIVNGNSKTFTVEASGNAAAGDENGIAWSSADETKVKVSPPHGPTVSVSACGSGKGQTYITASHSKAVAEKKVLVLTADSQEELDSMKGLYADATYFRVNEKASCELSVFTFGEFSDGDLNSIKWTTSDPNICTVNAGQNHLTASVAGVKAGRATVTASYGSSAPCVFDVTVVPEGESVDVIKAQYITTSKNAVVIPKVGESAELSVSCVNIPPEEVVNTCWGLRPGAESGICEIAASGERATVTASKEGKTVVQVSNPVSQNSVDINVKVGALYEWADDFYKYITTEEDTVLLVKGQTKKIAAKVENASNPEPRYSWTITGGKADVVNMVGYSDGFCNLIALEAGMAEITITHPAADFEKTILVVVSNTAEELAAIQYLTTSQNVVTVMETGRETVTVQVKNAPSNVLSGYTWMSKNPDIVDVQASGAVAVLYGKKQGSAKVQVVNDSCVYPLEIIVNCVDPVQAALNPYIQCENIVTLTVGDDARTITADLVGGTDGDKRNFSWSVADPTVASLLSSNDEAQVKALKEGVTQLVVRHPKANGIDRTVLLICEPKLAATCYINISPADSFTLDPSDGETVLQATLYSETEGAVSQSDQYNFKWWADDYSMVELRASNNECRVAPLATGWATLHCSHPKAAFDKVITIKISKYESLAFAEDQMVLTAGKQAFASLNVPTTRVPSKVVYKSGSNTICSASGTNSVCILDPKNVGNTVIYATLVDAGTPSKVLSGPAELLVRVEEAKQENTYINYGGSTIITLDKGQTMTLNATLEGSKAQDGDNKYLKWKSSDSGAVSIYPKPSSDGWTTNSYVTITGNAAGTDAAITVTHAKADSDLLLYVMVRGENEASIMLDHTELNLFTGDSPIPISATITNAAKDDYDNLVWTLDQDEANPVVQLGGSGKKVAVTPKREGSATLTATVPSSGRTASCVINVEKPRSITFDNAQLRVYPGKTFTIKYTVYPESEASSLVWTYSDNKYVAMAQDGDDHNGTATFYAKNTEGEHATTITAKTKSGATASCTVTNGFGNSFQLSKSLIQTIPVDKGDGTFEIKYELSPSCAEFYIDNLDGSKIALNPNCYASYDAAKNRYTVTAAQFDSVDAETDIGYGTLKFIPRGEWKGIPILTAYNNILINGNAVPQPQIASKTIQMNVYYSSHHFTLDSFRSDGAYSVHDKEGGIIVLGDGETVEFIPKCIEENGTPRIDAVNFNQVYEAKTQAEQKDDNHPANQMKKNGVTSENGGASYRVKLTRDYCKNEGYHGNYSSSNEADNVSQERNTTRREHIFAGTLDIHYTPAIGNPSVYSIPVYLDIRNCEKSYTGN